MEHATATLRIRHDAPCPRDDIWAMVRDGPCAGIEFVIGDDGADRWKAREIALRGGTARVRFCPDDQFAYLAPGDSPPNSLDDH